MNIIIIKDCQTWKTRFHRHVDSNSFSKVKTGDIFTDFKLKSISDHLTSFSMNNGFTFVIPNDSWVEKY